jgi:hypothetical protein
MLNTVFVVFFDLDPYECQPMESDSESARYLLF